MKASVVEDRTRRARIVARRALRFADGEAAVRAGVTAHVRAASGLAWMHDWRGQGPRLVLAQDDASAFALVAPESASVGCELVVLPHAVDGHRVFEARRGNKKAKLDLECCVAMELRGEHVVVAFGSGSTSARERAVVLEGSGRAVLVELGDLYAELRAAPWLASELNIEGAARLRDTLVLVQRGNGEALTGATDALDATVLVDLAEVVARLEGRGRTPKLATAVRWDLGALDAVRLTFTDAVAAPNDEGIVFVASAEASPNAYDDGVVTGAALGFIEASALRGDPGAAWWVRLVDADGAPSRAKVEGVALERPDARTHERLWLTVDRDDPDAPAELLEVLIEAAPGAS